ncbi:MAG: hypothetical protein HY815_07840 [Candidatus Riflebacteria bacterium]|nr:hypothetical protein [Candidatus Riflebacteria bacterium]
MIDPGSRVELLASAHGLRKALRERDRGFCYTLSNFGFITRDQLKEAEEEAGGRRSTIAEQLVASGAITPVRLEEGRAYYVVPTFDPVYEIDLAHTPPDPSLQALLPPDLVERHAMLAVMWIPWRQLLVAMPRPYDVIWITPESFELVIGSRVRPARAPEDVIRKLLASRSSGPSP